ncbi:Unknown protein, partial [Striga hermonthica]
GTLELTGQFLKTSAIEKECYRPLTNEEHPSRYEERARALILWCIGSFFFPDHRGNGVMLYWMQPLLEINEIKQYSWGSAVLAGVYRGLTLTARSGEIWIKNCVRLIQVWAWERIPRISPKMRDTNVDRVQGCPLGARWVGRRNMKHIGKGTTAIRDQLTWLTEND